ncbi:uncharacterized protein CEXT_212771 [Caerostris extrusa]|uniref:Uncharacterized protein n=1 Tax=Caerostris extrusa TaxID=172846 RepID=A0AAV4TB86_CAEEX|nr:uncharacterized protein CEXT_212771 [Caerostris extrusa]
MAEIKASALGPYGGSATQPSGVKSSIVIPASSATPHGINDILSRPTMTSPPTLGTLGATLPRFSLGVGPGMYFSPTNPSLHKLGLGDIPGRPSHVYWPTVNPLWRDRLTTPQVINNIILSFMAGAISHRRLNIRKKFKIFSKVPPLQIDAFKQVSIAKMFVFISFSVKYTTSLTHDNYVEELACFHLKSGYLELSINVRPCLLLVDSDPCSSYCLLSQSLTGPHHTSFRHHTCDVSAVSNKASRHYFRYFYFSHYIENQRTKSDNSQAIISSIILFEAEAKKSTMMQDWLYDVSPFKEEKRFLR